MPELPEVEAITEVVARHSVGQYIQTVEVLRQPKNNAYFGEVSPVGGLIKRVYRRGKHVLLELESPFRKKGFERGAWIDCHNAMSGYWDYEDEPWTFDYVEGPRQPDDHVRVKLSLSNGKILRFHDTRFFGRLTVVGNDGLPRVGPELMQTKMGAGTVITLKQFASSVLGERRPIKAVLMDQAVLAGIGNIYASEACHLAAVDPRQRGRDLHPTHVPVLLAALRCVVEHSMPTVRYDWLRVYRRERCGTCSGSVSRDEVGGRSTFYCMNCQEAL